MRVYQAKNYVADGAKLSVFISRRRPHDAEPLHTHDFIEIVYIFSGHSRHTADGREYAVGRGDVLFITPGSTHSFTSEEGFEYANICFDPACLSGDVLTPENAFALLSLNTFHELRGEERGGMLSLTGDDRRETEEILRAMKRECDAKEPSWQTAAESYLTVLLIKMLRQTRRGVAAETIDDVWRELADYIDTHLGERLTLSDLAQQCFYQPAYFSRVFKEKFGSSPLEYVTRKRLACAMALLTEEELSVDEVSLRAGFSDRRNFYHAFARYVGGTPSAYRNAHTKVKKSDKILL